MTDLPAGRELDALVAEKVMGLQVVGRHPCWNPEGPDLHPTMGGSGAMHPVYLAHCVCDLPLEDWERREAKRPGYYVEGSTHSWHCVACVSAYSTDIAATWEVVRRMREHHDPRKRNLQLVDYCYNRSYASFGADPYGPEWAEANGEHATPHAICLAALAAHFATGNGEARIVEEGT